MKKKGTLIKFGEEIYDFWIRENLFAVDPKSTKKPFSLLIPPPNLTGELHLGHAMQHSILDAVDRFKRLQGFDVLLLPGVDHAGIQFEATFDKELESRNLLKEKLGREKWLKLAWQFKEEIYRSVSSAWRMMGLSADWSREVFTLDPGPQKAVFEAFKTFYDKGLVYKGPYIVQWCPKCNTAIEDVEMEYEEREEKLYYIKYLLKDEGQATRAEKYITVATTRPETIFADVAVAVYPNHPLYKNLVGQKVFNPLTKKLMSVIEDKRVEKDFGTGALKITPAHDLLDFKIGRDHNLEALHAVDKSGRLTEIAGDFQGLAVLDGRKSVLEKLRRDSAIEKEEDYKHSVAVCERCKTAVEPLISEEWFVKVGDLARAAIRAIKDGKINFLPKNYARILVEWLENVHDWCISRSLWWGHRIPVWYPSTSLRIPDPSTRSARSGQASEMKVSLESPGKGWRQDEQVLDTWFSSGLWPLSTLGWPNIKAKGKRQKAKVIEENNLFERYYPWDFEISAPEIKYLWIARMIMLSLYFTGNVPFKTMFFHGMLRDLQGRKFSKSLGNGIDPTYLIDKWGVDATRMTLYTYSIPGRDGRVSREILDERGKNYRNFATKIRNIAKFVLELKPENNTVIATSPSVILSNSEESFNFAGDKSRSFVEYDSTQDDKGLHPDDKWIIDELKKTIKKVTEHLEKIELHLAVGEIYNFVWHKFADKYIEESKKRRLDAQPTLECVLKQVLILLHPFMPFLTEEIYQKFKVRRKSIMLEAWPAASVKR